MDRPPSLPRTSLICIDPELPADPALALEDAPPSAPRDWLTRLRAKHPERRARTRPTTDEAVHPVAIFACLRDPATPDHMAIADGDDLLGFPARGAAGGHQYERGGVRKSGLFALCSSTSVLP